ncbi:MAG: DUF853 domain-containing protein [Lachnospiraceae bacterium]|nr:DUF853 domain-containing protein [Lachnospiraceae bacterium]
MYKDGKIVIGNSESGEVAILPKMANRHGLIAGVTGMGKTVTLRVLAESFSAAGVPVFLADAKGDISGLFEPGEGEEPKGFPVILWDVYQQGGMPLRVTISEMGPLLLSRILGLNDTQSDIMTIIFKIMDDEGTLIIDTKDLKEALSYVGEHASEYSLTYGNIAKQSLAAIIRSVVALESEGGDLFFGETAVDFHDWISFDQNGYGRINILDCRKLMLSPTMYSTFMLWMMSELFENLPEVGDCDKPKMVFFFDEAHMLFDGASKELLQKIEQVVKLIRSKGVGIYFVTQNPMDIPDGVLSQLNNKIQHGLHAYTPAEQKSVKAAAMSFRENPAFDTYETLTTLGIGEALVSVLDENGAPMISEKVKVCYPPQSKMGAITDAERDAHFKNDNLYTKYSTYVDNDSAFEFLQRKRLTDNQEAEEAAALAAAEKQAARDAAAAEKQAAREQAAAEKAAQKQAEQNSKQVKRAAKSVANTAAGTIGREIGKSVGSAGGKFGKTLGGNVGAALGRGILSTLFKV